jgi:cell division protease FtsH
MGSRRLYGEATARDIDVAVRSLVEAQLEKAGAILSANRPLLERSAKALLAAESLAGPELDAILAEVQRAPPPAIPPGSQPG